MKKVYLSCAPADAPRADEIAHILQAQGHAPWLGPGPSQSAETFPQRDAAIREAEALVTLVTAAACASPHVTYEWAFALGAGIPVFALILEDADEHPGLEQAIRCHRRDFKDENHFWDHFVRSFQQRMTSLPAPRSAIDAAPERVHIDATVMPTEPGYWLVMRRGPHPNQLIRLEREVVAIGRDLANDIVINHAQVSRYHLRLTLRGNDYRIDDLASTNGTRLNNVRLAGRATLHDGDVITLGDAILLSYDLVYLEDDAQPE